MTFAPQAILFGHTSEKHSQGWKVPIGACMSLLIAHSRVKLGDLYQILYYLTFEIPVSLQIKNIMTDEYNRIECW